MSIEEIPDDLQDVSEEYRERMVEAAAEANDELMDAYLESGELSEDQIIEGLRQRTLKLEIVPMCVGSAFKNKGVQAMLDKVVELLPAPTEVPAIRGCTR